MFNMFMKDGKVKEELKTQPEKVAQEYYYFLKVVPHVFVDLIEQKEWRSYSYSLGHNKKDTQTPTFVNLSIILDYAPVKMILTKQQRDFGRFAINMCSIVGGVFIICGLLNSMLLAIFSKCK
jgi:hypothetical protein